MLTKYVNKEKFISNESNFQSKDYNYFFQFDSHFLRNKME